MGQLRQNFPTIPIMALTATANGRTETDIVNNLHLRDPFVTRSSFNRANLHYDVRPKTKVVEDISKFIKPMINESGIIYCLSRNDCEKVSADLITLLGLPPNTHKISFYHAGLESDLRKKRHHDWSKGKIKLIVATLAFGYVTT